MGSDPHDDMARVRQGLGVIRVPENSGPVVERFLPITATDLNRRVRELEAERDEWKIRAEQAEAAMQRMVDRVREANPDAAGGG